MYNVPDSLKSYKLNFLMMFSLAFLAAVATFCFALSSGVKSISTIVYRVFLSFVIFAIIGFLATNLLVKEYLQGVLAPIKANENDLVSNEELSDIPVSDEEGQTAVDGLINEDSFDEIVMVNKDAE